MSKDKKINEETTKKEEIVNLQEDEKKVDTKEENKENEIKHEKRNGSSEKSVAKIDTEEEKKYRKIRLTIMIVLAVIFAMFILFAVIACVNKLNDKVYKNVYLFGQDISGMSKSQVEEILNTVNNDVKNKKISVYQDTEEIITVSSEEIGFSIDVANTLKNTMGFGRLKNIFLNNFDILVALIKPVNIDVSYIYDDLKVENVLKNIDLTIKDRAVDDSYNIDEANSKLIITKGKTGNSIDYNNQKEQLLLAFKDISKQKLILDITKRAPQELDVDKVYSEVKREAKDAYIDENSQPIKFVSEVVGLDFDIEELKNLLSSSENKEEGKVIEFPLKVTEPNVKLKDISAKYYNDKLAGKTTYFDASQGARANNLKIALDYLNGKIVMPGEVFSYNNAIGDTTSAKGYMAAATFKGGTVVNEMGGGICQTTSTLYDVALMANLEIVERHQHRTTSRICTTKFRCYSVFTSFRF